MATQNNDNQSEDTTQNQMDINEIFKENFDKYFQEVEKVMPQYLQTMTKLQEEFLDAWKNTVNTSIDFQKEYLEKTNINTNIPKDAAHIIYSMAEEYIKSKTLQNQVILSSLNSTSSNFKDSKNSFEQFSEMNKKILNFWLNFYTKNK